MPILPSAPPKVQRPFSLPGKPLFFVAHPSVVGIVRHLNVVQCAPEIGPCVEVVHILFDVAEGHAAVDGICVDRRGVAVPIHISVETDELLGWPFVVGCVSQRLCQYPGTSTGAMDQEMEIDVLKCPNSVLNSKRVIRSGSPFSQGQPAPSHTTPFRPWLTSSFAK